jgi:exodeoxyribonuclease VII large subunit
MSLDKNPENPILSVSELNQYARGVLEMHVGKIAVMGEISNFSKPSSGHWYFTLKDQQAQIRCAMFRNKNQFLRLRPENGIQVIINGTVSIYEGRGDYQLVADYIEEAGIGALQKQFEQLKAKLAAEGLFDSKHKQALPKSPQHIAVITSPTGAAIHDILSVLNERYPLLRVTLIPAAVQGHNATHEICHAIALAERWNTENIDSIDAIIVGRGGGSIEDLWAFNEEAVARAIFACKIPIISAVGHEVDISIADYVADVRAPTPSAAAEIISLDQEALMQQLDHHEESFIGYINHQLHNQQKELRILQKSLKHPGERLQQYRLRFNQLSKQLVNSELYVIQQKQHNIALLKQAFAQHKPINLLQQHSATIEECFIDLKKALQSMLKEKKLAFKQQSQLLNTVSPLATLERGYAITRDENNHIIRNTKDRTVGESITTTLASGELISTITHINK